MASRWLVGISSSAFWSCTRFSPARSKAPDRGSSMTALVSRESWCTHSRRDLLPGIRISSVA